MEKIPADTPTNTETVSSARFPLILLTEQRIEDVQPPFPSFPHPSIWFFHILSVHYS